MTHSLQRRLVAAFAGIAAATALLFGVLCIVLAYSLEDAFFARMLDEEAAHQLEHWQAHGRYTQPQRDYFRLYEKASDLPSDLARQLRREAAAGEYFGDAGRHYHLSTLNPEGEASAYLVAEVSRYLFVRPIRADLMRLVGLGAIAVTMLIAALGYLLARRASAPLTRLAGLVAASRPEHLPTGFSKDFPTNEIGVLADALDQALTRTQSMVERERQFTRDASHELRTPITVIRGAAELLQAQPLPAAAGAPLRRIAEACGDMEQSVAALLALARETPVAVGDTPIALLPAVETAVLQHAHRLEGKPVELVIDVAEAVTVSVSRPALLMILGNIIGNAFSHVSAGCIRIHGAGTALVIVDTGRGIEPAIRDRLGELGIKGTASGGFGYGLSIVRRLCERNGITLTIGDGEAGGTRVCLCFPRSEASP